jgi:hypothetical protein
VSAKAGACLTAFGSTGAAARGGYAVIRTVDTENVAAGRFERSGSPETATVTVEFAGARVEVRGAPGLGVLSVVIFGVTQDALMLMPSAGIAVYVVTSRGLQEGCGGPCAFGGGAGL